MIQPPIPGAAKTPLFRHSAHLFDSIQATVSILANYSAYTDHDAATQKLSGVLGSLAPFLKFDPDICSDRIYPGNFAGVESIARGIDLLVAVQSRRLAFLRSSGIGY